MAKEKGIRAKRREQILNPVGSFMYGNEFLLGLVQSAQGLLLAARAERRTKDGENFLTFHGPSAILLAVTAFESFINDMLHSSMEEHEQRG